MKSITSLMTSALMLLWIASSSSCASSAEASLPRLELRTLRLRKDRPALEYAWRECAKKGLFGCSQWVQKTEVYDLTDPKIRAQLVDMGFVMKVREKPL